MIPPRWALYLAGAVVALLGYAGWARSEQSKGALKFQLAALDSAHHVAVQVADSALVVASSATLESDRVKAEALAKVERGKVVARQADSTARASADERRRAENILRDSLATTATLREEIARLVEVARRDSVSHARKQSVDADAIAALLQSVHAQDVALSRQQEATASEVRRALLAEQEVQVLRKQIGGATKNWVTAGIYIAAGFGVARLIK